jgi:TRAP-type C4-dicarboxylate transport system permease small subunit
MSNIINNGFAVFCGVMIFGIAILTCVDICLGFLFNKPITGCMEIIVLTLPWFISLGLAFGLIKGAHVRVTFIVGRFSPKKRLCLDSISQFLAFVFFCILTYGTWIHFWSSWSIREEMFAALASLPWWLGKLALPVGFFLIGAQHLLELIGVLGKKEV